MSPGLIVEPLLGPEQLAGLEADARADGRAIVSRLIEEWRSGRNRFSSRGERAFVARRDERVCGVGGLNRDPFAKDDSIGRVRRLYVSVGDRRSGIGSAIVDRLIEHAHGVYAWLHVRTHDPDSAAFYEARGFERIVGEADFTHRRRLRG